MAVSIDTVYQTVQALANKEQRGYITPQEFNLFAYQAQDDIFEQYLYDLEAMRAQRPQKHQLGDTVTHIMEKLSGWYSIQNVVGGTNLPSGHIGEIFLNQGTSIRRALKPVSPDTVSDLLASKFHKRGFSDAVYFDDGYKKIQVWDKLGQIAYGITCEAVQGRPILPYWGYIVVNEKPTYNADASQDFQLHRSEQTDLVIKILKLAGISIEDQQLYQGAQAEDSLNTQQENK
jgi:hypothetical protein